jgi:hypothetical protein
MPEQLVERIAILEAEVARLRNKVEENSPSEPWWVKITGKFADQPAYDEAMKLGREYRESLEPISNDSSES